MRGAWSIDHGTYYNQLTKIRSLRLVDASETRVGPTHTITLEEYRRQQAAAEKHANEAA